MVALLPINTCNFPGPFFWKMLWPFHFIPSFVCEGGIMPVTFLATRLFVGGEKMVFLSCLKKVELVMVSQTVSLWLFFLPYRVTCML